MRNKNNSAALEYINDLYAPEDELLRGIRERMRSDGKEGIAVSPLEGRILGFFSSMLSVNKVVEIGTLYGYSSIWLARSLSEEGRLFTLESNAEHSAVAEGFFAESGLSDKISLLSGPALDSLAGLQNKGPFDLVFIDANKSGYPDYLDWAYGNLKVGGLIIADNTLLFDKVYLPTAEKPVSKNQWSSMRKFNTLLADRKKFDGIMFPTSEGLSVARKIS